MGISGTFGYSQFSPNSLTARYFHRKHCPTFEKISIFECTIYTVLLEIDVSAVLIRLIFGLHDFWSGLRFLTYEFYRY